jgi:hypothetical protein
MSYLNDLTKKTIEDALNSLIQEKRVNTEGVYWKLNFKNFHFSPNVVIRKAGEIIGIKGVKLKNFTGGNGSSGAITKLQELGFELVDKRVSKK